MAARTEASRKPLQAYMEAIVELKENKGFSFREIAERFCEHHIKTDHNLVYREYRKDLVKRANEKKRCGGLATIQVILNGKKQRKINERTSSKFSDQKKGGRNLVLLYSYN